MLISIQKVKPVQQPAVLIIKGREGSGSGCRKRLATSRKEVKKGP
jgi:hypothetical protein